MCYGDIIEGRETFVFPRRSYFWGYLENRGDRSSTINNVAAEYTNLRISKSTNETRLNENVEFRDAHSFLEHLFLIRSYIYLYLFTFSRCRQNVKNVRDGSFVLLQFSYYVYL